MYKLTHSFPTIANISVNPLLILCSIFFCLNIVFSSYNFHLGIFIILVSPNYIQVLLFIFVHIYNVYNIFKSLIILSFLITMFVSIIGCSLGYRLYFPAFLHAW